MPCMPRERSRSTKAWLIGAHCIMGVQSRPPSNQWSLASAARPSHIRSTSAVIQVRISAASLALAGSSLFRRLGFTMKRRIAAAMIATITAAPNRSMRKPKIA